MTDIQEKPFTYLVLWNNPYTEPPDGMPRILLSVPTDVRVVPAEVCELKEILGYGSGWMVAFDWAIKHRKGWTIEAKQRVRRSRLQRRIEKKYPMFAAEFIQEAYMRKPEYYGITLEGA